MQEKTVTNLSKEVGSLPYITSTVGKDVCLLSLVVCSIVLLCPSFIGCHSGVLKHCGFIMILACQRQILFCRNDICIQITDWPPVTRVHRAELHRSDCISPAIEIRFTDDRPASILLSDAGIDRRKHSLENIIAVLTGLMRKIYDNRFKAISITPAFIIILKIRNYLNRQRKARMLKHRFYICLI